MPTTTDSLYRGAAAASTPRGVVIVSPGGLDGGGGMGSVAREMTLWIETNLPTMRLDVVDPRGDGSAAWTLFHLPKAVFEIIWARLWYRSEIIHLNVSERLSFFRKGLLLLLGKLLGMKVVLHHHGAEFIQFFQESPKWIQHLVRAAVRCADLNIVLGEKWSHFLQLMKVPTAKIVVAYNAVADVRTKTPTRRDPWHFLLVANLSERKGVSDLFDALAILIAKGHPARLTLAGGGDVTRYKKEAQSKGLLERCVFAGWVTRSRVAELLNSCGTLVLPSYDEGLPMAVLEALSAEIPIATTPVGSLPEVLRHRSTCLFVEPGDTSQLSIVLLELATNQSLREALTRNGRNLYEKDFDIGVYMQRMLRIYNRLIGNSEQLGPNR